MGELTQLEILDLAKNKQVGVDETGISGGIPAEIGNLKSLTTLVLFENRLTGKLLLPSCYGSLWLSSVLMLNPPSLIQFQVLCPSKSVALQN